jgi:hypothetical protein
MTFWNALGGEGQRGRVVAGEADQANDTLNGATRRLSPRGKLNYDDTISIFSHQRPALTRHR